MDEPSPANDHFVIQILDSWPRLAKLLLVLLAVVATVWLAAISVLRALPPQAGEVQFGIGESRVLIKQPTKNGESSLLVVSPQAWNRTGIQIKEGDVFTIEAAGRIHIDLSGLVNSLEARRAAEARIKLAGVRRPGTTPEDYYTPKEIKAIRDTWDWSGPDGVPKELMDSRSIPERRAKSIRPEEPYGELVGAFDNSDDDPDKFSSRLATSAFKIGKHHTEKATAKSNGFLYLAVNDVQYAPGPQIFFMDNVGAFYVKVEVSSK